MAMTAKEDAQNPNPKCLQTPPPKQKAETDITPTPPSLPRRTNASSQLSLPSSDTTATKARPHRADTQETLVDVTPARATRKTPPSTAEQVHAALQRANTVDQISLSERKRKAQAMQKELEEEHESCKATAEAEAEAASAKENPAEAKHTRSTAKAGIANGGKRKIVDLGGPAAKPKTRKLTKDDKAKAMAEKIQTAYEMKDHDTARSSHEAMPVKTPKGKAKAAAKANSKAPRPKTSEKQSEQPKRSSLKEDAKPAARAKSEAPATPKKIPSKVIKVLKGKRGNANKKVKKDARMKTKAKKDQKTCNSGRDDEMRKEAHKLYMRFWRSVTKSHCLSFQS